MISGVAKLIEQAPSWCSIICQEASSDKIVYLSSKLAGSKGLRAGIEFTVTESWLVHEAITTFRLYDGHWKSYLNA